MMQQRLTSSPMAPNLLPTRPCRSPFRSPARSHVCCSSTPDDGDSAPAPLHARRDVLGSAALALGGIASALKSGEAQALGFKKDLQKGRRVNISESQYKDLQEGLKYYDVKVGGGQTARVGDRVAVHYEARWRGVTFMTSRQGMGVTGGSPIGFDVGTDPEYGTLKGLDLGVRGMKVGGQRKLIVPPNLAYGDKGIGEIPGGATLNLEVELLSIKNSPFGSRAKIVEGRVGA